MGRQSAGERAPIGGHRASGWASPRVQWDFDSAAYAGSGRQITIPFEIRKLGLFRPA